jgi:hypothetical protein
VADLVEMEDDGDFDLENELMDEESYYNEIRGGYPEEEGQHDSSSMYGGEESAAMSNYVEELLQLEKESEIKKKGMEQVRLEAEGVAQSDMSNINPSSSLLGGQRHLPSSPSAIVGNQESILNNIKPWDESVKKPFERPSQPAVAGSTSSLFSSSGRAGVGGAGGGYMTQLPSFISASLESKKFLKERPSLGDDCQSVTLPNGKRKYIYYRRDPPLKSVISERDSLLSKPIEEILREAERKKIASLAAHEENTLDGSRELFSGESSLSASTNPLSHARQQLWVDKYAPKAFSQVPTFLPSLPSSLLPFPHPLIHCRR